MTSVATRCVQSVPPCSERPGHAASGVVFSAATGCDAGTYNDDPVPCATRTSLDLTGDTAANDDGPAAPVEGAREVTEMIGVAHLYLM